VYISQTPSTKGCNLERSLERSAVDEACEELEGLARGGLRHLVAATLDGDEGERTLLERKRYKDEEKGNESRSYQKQEAICAHIKKTCSR